MRNLPICYYMSIILNSKLFLLCHPGGSVCPRDTLHMACLRSGGRTGMSPRDMTSKANVLSRWALVSTPMHVPANSAMEHWVWIQCLFGNSQECVFLRSIFCAQNGRNIMPFILVEFFDYSRHSILFYIRFRGAVSPQTGLGPPPLHRHHTWSLQYHSLKIANLLKLMISCWNHLRENREPSKMYEIFGIFQTLFSHSPERGSDGKFLGIFKIASKMPTTF